MAKKVLIGLNRQARLGGGWATVRLTEADDLGGMEPGQYFVQERDVPDREDEVHTLAMTFQEAMRCGILRDVRKARVDTQTEAAEAMDLRQSTTSEWESGKQSPSKHVKQRVQDYLLGHRKLAEDTQVELPPRTMAEIEAAATVLKGSPADIIHSALRGNPVLQRAQEKDQQTYDEIYRRVALRLLEDEVREI